MLRPHAWPSSCPCNSTPAGIFNTIYYTATFAFFWLVVAKVPRGLGLAASAQKFLTVMAAVWAGSQVRERHALGGLGWLRAVPVCCAVPHSTAMLEALEGLCCVQMRSSTCCLLWCSALGATSTLLSPPQVTKVPRAAAALVLAPVVDRLMAWLQRVGKLESRRQVRGRAVLRWLPRSMWLHTCCCCWGSSAGQPPSLPSQPAGVWLLCGLLPGPGLHPLQRRCAGVGVRRLEQLPCRVQAIRTEQLDAARDGPAVRMQLKPHTILGLDWDQHGLCNCIDECLDVRVSDVMLRMDGRR